MRTTDNHPLRRAYHVVRRLPGVSNAWRKIDTGAIPDEAEFVRYVERKGQFGPSADHDPGVLPPVVDFDSEDFFPNLLARIAACEPTPQAGDAIVLINNGLSAGGAERQIVNTLTGLKQRGVDATFIGEKLSAAPGHDFHLATLRQAGVSALALEQLSRPGKQLFNFISRPVAEQLFRISPSMLLEILDMTRMLRAIRPRVVHLWQDETSIKHSISAMLAGAPRIVLSGRNINPTHFGYHHAFMRPAYRGLLNQPGVVFSNNSHAGARSYADWLGTDASRIRVVHNGIDFSDWPKFDEALRTSTRQALGVSPLEKLVLGVFRLSEEKRPLLWADVAAATLKTNNAVRFAIAGDGPMRPDLVRRLAELGIADKVQLVGQRQDVGALFMASDVFLLASAHEGVPNVLIEAQYYGRPVLTTRAGGAPEAVAGGETGRISAAEDAASLARQLSDLLGDQAFADRARQQGPAFVAKAFSIDRMIEDTLALYDAGTPGATRG
ncbi:MAG TPA: glycosyltransferase [Hyphomonadaceae bacterium]|nr:glycosyltransferase [Hyphomonadaceae bacterium]